MPLADLGPVGLRMLLVPVALRFLTLVREEELGREEGWGVTLGSFRLCTFCEEISSVFKDDFGQGNGLPFHEDKSSRPAYPILSLGLRVPNMTSPT